MTAASGWQGTWVGTALCRRRQRLQLIRYTAQKDFLDQKGPALDDGPVFGNRNQNRFIPDTEGIASGNVDGAKIQVLVHQTGVRVGGDGFLWRRRLDELRPDLQFGATRLKAVLGW